VGQVWRHHFAIKPGSGETVGFPVLHGMDRATMVTAFPTENGAIVPAWAL
jgi:hypothetical protein